VDPKANCATDLSRVCSSSGSSDLSSVSSSSSVPVTPGAANAGAAPNALVLSSTPTGGYPVSVLAPSGPSSRNGADAGYHGLRPFPFLHLFWLPVVPLLGMVLMLGLLPCYSRVTTSMTVPALE